MTSLITEAVKKAFQVKRPNIVALIVSIIVGAGVPCGYIIITPELVMTVQDIVYVIALIVLTWLCSTLGYDKVIQTLAQIGGKDKE